jgi:hypothetical protein
MTITPIKLQPTKSGKHCATIPRVTLSFANNRLVINKAMRDKLSLSVGDYLAIAFENTGTMNPNLCIAKSKELNPSMCVVLRDGRTNGALAASSRSLIRAIADRYGITTTQYASLVWQPAEGYLIERSGGYEWHVLGTPQKMKTTK